MEMENEQAFEDLLIRYLSNETNEVETENIEQWITASESNLRHFNELKKVWRLTTIQQDLKKIDVEAEWSQFSKAANQPKALPTAIIELPQRNFRTSWLVAASIAALLLLLAGIRYNWIGKRQSGETELVGNTHQQKDPVHELSRHERNYSGKIKQLVLSDGTEVMLFDSSELVFADRFKQNNRIITLTGKAEFKVAKDSTRPFTVISGEIATTALGTQFLVDDQREPAAILVKLYEGKVVIRPSDSLHPKLERDFYLQPGQELVYDRNKNTAFSRRFRITEGLSKGEGQSSGSNDNPSIPNVGKGNWYMFNNESLAHVFDQLEDMYGVTIDYSRDDLRNKYFIGRFDKSASLEKILSQIAQLNNLKLIKKNEKFIISK